MNDYTRYVARFTQRKVADGAEADSFTLNFKSWERRNFAIAYWKYKGYTAVIL